jgi:membrane-associated phospholipid phosphatase
VKAGRPAPAAAPRAERPRLTWDPGWAPFRTGEYVATGVFALGAVGSLLVPAAPRRWRANNSFDDAVRGALRPDDEGDRLLARDLSDILLGITANYPVFVDAFVVTWWGHENSGIAWQLAMMDIEALAVSAFVNGWVTAIASRERPYDRSCTGRDEDSEDCRRTRRYRSFYSGHASTAFAGAGLICVHHAHLPLYGGGLPDGIVCGLGLAAAGATATLRVVADQHFASDVITGAAMGLASGIGVPWLLHYRSGGAPKPNAGADVALAPGPTPLGMGLHGRF